MPKQYYCGGCKSHIDEKRVKHEPRKGTMKAICPFCGRIIGSEKPGTSSRNWL